MFGEIGIHSIWVKYRIRSSPPASTVVREEDDICGASPSRHVTRQDMQPCALCPAHMERVPAAVPGGSHTSGSSQRAAGAVQTTRASTQPVGTTSGRQEQSSKCIRDMTI